MEFTDTFALLNIAAFLRVHNTAAANSSSAHVQEEDNTNTDPVYMGPKILLIVTLIIWNQNVFANLIRPEANKFPFRLKAVVPFNIRHS